MYFCRNFEDVSSFNELLTVCCFKIKMIARNLVVKKNQWNIYTYGFKIDIKLIK